MAASAGDTLDALAARKKTLRSELRTWRNGLPFTQRCAAARDVTRQFLHLRKLRTARHVAVYLSCAGELDTAPLVRALHTRRTQVYVPAIAHRNGQRQMQFVALGAHTPLRRTSHGLREPALPRRLMPVRKLDVVLVPLLAFDRHGGRLGQGGGYYDRSFAHRCVRRPLLIGYAYAEQCVAGLPLAAWDVRLDAVLTERGLLRCPPDHRPQRPHTPTGTTR